MDAGAAGVPVTGRTRRRMERLVRWHLTGLGAFALAACRREGDDPLRQLDAPTRRLGAAVYVERCAACHGAAGEGAPHWKLWGPDGRLPPPPQDSTGHTWHHADGLLYRIVAHGMAGALGDTGRAASRTLRYSMPGFDSVLSPREITAVVSYLKVGWTPAQRRRQAEASRDDPFPGPDSAGPLPGLGRR